MGAPMHVDSDFKSQFYNLQGIHINERKKNFYKLLKTTSLDLPDDQIDIQPRNYLEKIFYIDVLIHFKKVEKLTDVLQDGNGVLVSKVLKQKWFFQEAFKNMSEEDIVNTFLPTLSKSLRMKVLKKLSLTLGEERMDTIFDLTLERYGLFIAKQFLFSCSPEKIIHVLKNNEIVLCAEQLKRLLQKDIKLLKVYIEEYKKNTRKDIYDYDFLNYLVWKHPNLYFELGLNNQSVIKLGRCTSRAVIKTNKEDVIKDIKNSNLNKATLVREVKEFDKEYFYLFFPADMKHITYNSKLQSLVSKYPIKKRWEVFSKGFKQAYNKEITEHLNEFEDEFAKLFPKEIQHRWAELKYLYYDNLKYIKYYDPKKAFSLLKDKINVTSDINQRGKLLNELITVCYTDKDYSTYEEVLKYICVRHRNDDRNVRSNMISHITKNIDFSLITETHWQHINEIIDIQRVRGENLPFELITEYLLFIYRKNIPLDGPVMQYTKDCLIDNWSFRLRYRDNVKNPEAESSILKHIIKILPMIEHKNRAQATYRILSNVVDFNKEIKDNKMFTQIWIDLNKCTFIMDLIKEVCAKQDYNSQDCEVVEKIISYNCSYSEVPLKDIDEKDLLNITKTMMVNNLSGYLKINSILEVIKKPKRNNFENTLLDYFFSLVDNEYFYLKQDAVKYFISKEPQVVAKYFDFILSIEAKQYYEILDYDKIKQYDHLGLSEKVVDHFKALVSVDSKSDKKAKLLKGLSKVMTTKDFLDLVKDYTPKAKKLDLNDDLQKEMYQVQCDIAKAFRNLDDVSILAPVVMQYSQGDYLQSSLGALYRVLYRLNEENAFSYIRVLGSRAMSTRKHAVFLGLELLSLKDAMSLSSDLSNKETNISAKKYLFDAVLKYFIKNPLESVLDIVFLNMSFVDKNDTEMIQTLVDSVSQILNKYKPLFIEKVWNFLDVLKRQEVKVTAFRNELLLLINSYETSFMLKLNHCFCEDIIKKYFLSADDSLQKKSDYIEHFVINYLLAYLGETHFQFVFNIIKTYKDRHWESNNEGSRTYVFRFFLNAYEKFDQNDAKFLNMFTSSWQHLFSHVESFTQYSLLRLMGLCKENKNIEMFSLKVDKFLQELTGEYGPYIVDLLTNSIKTFFSNLPSKYNTDFNLGNFTYYLLKTNSSELNCYIAFKIIQNFSSTDQKDIYSKVVDALYNVDNLTAKIYYNVLLKKNK